MIRVNLDKLSQKLGKNISEIARETGINRNTITSLYHNKVDGIKFATLETLCQKYNLVLSDILEYKEKDKQEKSRGLYKQEGEIVPFTTWPPVLAVCRPNKKYFELDLKRLDIYYKKDYSYWYWDKSAMREFARNVYKRFSSPQKFKPFFEDYLSYALVLENYYFSHDEQDILRFSEKEVLEFFEKMRRAYADFWEISLFIDAFDEGFDHEEIKRIADKYNLSMDEVGILTSPVEMTFSNERILELLRIAHKFKKTDLNKLGKIVREDLEIRKYIKKFDCYKSNYAYIDHISYSELEEELKKYINDSQKLKLEMQRLENYLSGQEKRIDSVLKKHKLTVNPLFFFNRLTYWREIRKQTNLMGIHLLFAILKNISAKTGIDLKYISFISFDEVKNVLRGLINKDILRQRMEKGLFVIMEKQGYKIYEGDEANSLMNEAEKNLAQGQEKDIVFGQVASQGYAKGVARIILNLSDFGKFKEGEVLVT
ncbi:MAG: helix-turn-helix domain-containing protein, partial [Patescibacteria group bacterium]